jgi:hypothetical protein
LNSGHWSSSCVPSCGVIQEFCGTPTDCCPGGAVCAYGEPGGASNDCTHCCAYACCYPSQVEEYWCDDGLDNDCDADVDCSDPACEGQYCGGSSGYCVSGSCTY